jgi:hypothetical protein
MRRTSREGGPTAKGENHDTARPCTRHKNRWPGLSSHLNTLLGEGRGYGRSGVVQGSDGPLYDTRSPESRMSDGNIFVYEQLVEQKMMLQQQKLMMRQQQTLMRQMQQGARNGAGACPSGHHPKERRTHLQL